MKHKVYQKYKKTLFEYFPLIPEHWNIKRMKFILDEPLKYGANEAAELDDKNLPRYIRITDIDESGKLRNETFKSIEIDIALPYLLKDGDILLARSGATVGKSFIYKQEWGLAAYAGYLIRARMDSENNSKFIHYFLNSYAYWDWLKSIFIQATIQNVSAGKYASLLLPIPSLSEQRYIAEFLDYKTAQIDELIEKKGQLLKLLEEKRIALITQAVTKGIDQNVKMKPSGVDWLGDIPEHWEVKRLKYVSTIQFSGVDKKTEDDETEVLLCNYVDVYKNEFIDKNIDFMKATATESEINKFTVEEGDVLVTKDSETPYDIAVPSLIIENLPNVLCGYHLAQIKPNKNILLPPYLFRLFQSKNFNVHFTVSANGITRFGVGTDVFGNAKVPVFSKKEQQKIFDYIQTNCDRVKALEKTIAKAIEKLKEYRTSLITSAVTGKIRVPTGDVKDYKTSKKGKHNGI